MSEERHDALELAQRAARAWLDDLDTGSVASTTTAEELRRRLKGPLPEAGMSAPDAVARLLDVTEGGLLGSAGGRFFAWVIGGGLESAVAADWLVTAWDQNAALHVCSPAASEVEAAAGRWLLELFDLPRESGFAFTTGCQMAHVSALAAARHFVLQAQGWDVAEEGLQGAPPLRVLVNEERHGSVDRAVRLIGLGQRSLRPVAADASGRADVRAFERELDREEGPVVVVLNAADLNVGACDRFEELVPMAQQRGAWVHVDSAFGLFARVSAQYAPLVRGIEKADSWATDAHKWLNVPFDCGVAFVRRADALRQAMSVSASYVAPSDESRDQIDWNPEWSRRARGVPVYAALCELGRSGVAEMIERCCACCAQLVEDLGHLAGAEVVCSPQLNQGLVTFPHPREDASAEDQAAYVDAVIERINATGEAFFSGTTWKGIRAMRVSVVNWKTDERAVERAVHAAREALAAVRADAGHAGR